jgi:hypothetical protein
MRRIVVLGFKQLTITIALLTLLTGNAAASTIVFEKVELFKNKTFFTEELQLDAAGNYEATLTDFEFPQPLKKVALNVTTAKDTLGTIFGPGSFNFEADPGTYYVSLFAVAGKGNDRNKDSEYRKNKNKQKYKNKQKHKDNNHARKNNDGKSARKEARGAWQAEWRPPEPAYDGGTLNLGQYGVEIAHTEQTVVPIPAAVWLFLSGLLSVGAIGMRRLGR